jgi:uncharacterized protein Smg (DUF494 family)
MKYEVTTNFIDKNTHAYFKADSVFETDSPDRAKELQRAGFIGEEIKNPLAAVLEKNVTEIKSTVTKEEFSVEQINELIALEEVGEGRKGVRDHLAALLEG